MFVKYEFNLEDPEDYRLLRKVFQPAQDFSFALWDTSQMFKNILKYNNQNYSGEQLQAIEDLQEYFNEILQEHNIKNIIEEG